MLKNNFLIIESLLFIGAGAGAGEKITRSRSKTDRLRNTASRGQQFGVDMCCAVFSIHFDNTEDTGTGKKTSQKTMINKNALNSTLYHIISDPDP